MASGALMHVLVFVTMLCTSVQYARALNSPINEFGASDLVSLGVIKADAVRTPPPKPSSGARAPVAKGVGTIGEVSSNTVQEVFLIATAKVRGAAHFSRPYIVVDIEEESGESCGPYAWLFDPSCTGPEINKKITAVFDRELSDSFVSAFKLPNGWENLRVTLPTNGRCGWNGSSDRTAFMRIASPTNMCMTASFKYRSCSFWRCTRKDCDRLHMLARLITIGPDGEEIRPYTAYDNGIEICPAGSIKNLFLKK